MDKVRILETALKAVSGDRGKTHGSAYENMRHTAQMWNAYLDGRQNITPLDVAHMMVLHKQSRAMQGDPKFDDHYVDQVGYAAIAGEIAQRAPVVMGAKQGEGHAARKPLVVGKMSPELLVALGADAASVAGTGRTEGYADDNMAERLVPRNLGPISPEKLLKLVVGEKIRIVDDEGWFDIQEVRPGHGVFPEYKITRENDPYGNFLIVRSNLIVDHKPA